MVWRKGNALGSPGAFEPNEWADSAKKETEFPQKKSVRIDRIQKKELPLHRRSYLRDVEPASLCREPTRTLNKNQEEPFAVAEALTLEAATL
jgi:hypothetical protein